jgi:hypothetical protein
MRARARLGPYVPNAEANDLVGNAYAVPPLRKGRSKICCLDKERVSDHGVNSLKINRLIS